MSANFSEVLGTLAGCTLEKVFFDKDKEIFGFFDAKKTGVFDDV